MYSIQYYYTNNSTKGNAGGNLLGDGYMQRKKVTQNPTLTIDQTYPKHKEHVEYIYMISRKILHCLLLELLSGTLRRETYW